MNNVAAAAMKTTMGGGIGRAEEAGLFQGQGWGGGGRVQGGGLSSVPVEVSPPQRG